MTYQRKCKFSSEMEGPTPSKSSCQIFMIACLHLKCACRLDAFKALFFSHRIIALSFSAAIGVLFVILGCALEQYGCV